MTELQPIEKQPVTIHQLIKAENTQEAFRKVLGNRAEQYIASIITMVNNNELVKKCEPISLVNACIIAATLDLSIDPNLGFAYIVPYKNKAQFQMGWKGFVQLAIRTGEYRRLGATKVYEGQLFELDEFGEPIFDFNNKTSDKVIGYMAYFELINGFRKISYMSKEEAERHGKKYSQTYKKGFGVWKDDFDGMAKKTVLKLLLSKFAPLSTQMQKAIIDDQKVEDDYLDNKVVFDVEDAAIEGETIDDGEHIDAEPIDEPTEIDEPETEEESEPTEELKSKPTLGALKKEQLITQPQLRKGFAILNKLSDDNKQIAEKGVLQMFGEKSRKDYTREEASQWIEYLESFEAANGS